MLYFLLYENNADKNKTLKAKQQKPDLPLIMMVMSHELCVPLNESHNRDAQRVVNGGK